MQCGCGVKARKPCAPDCSPKRARVEEEKKNCSRFCVRLSRQEWLEESPRPTSFKGAEEEEGRTEGIPAKI